MGRDRRRRLEKRTTRGYVGNKVGTIWDDDSEGDGDTETSTTRRTYLMRGEDPSEGPVVHCQSWKENHEGDMKYVVELITWMVKHGLLDARGKSIPKIHVVKDFASRVRPVDRFQTTHKLICPFTYLLSPETTFLPLSKLSYVKLCDFLGRRDRTRTNGLRSPGTPPSSFTSVYLTPSESKNRDLWLTN